MQFETNGKQLTALLRLYNKEIDTLKSKLLNGIPWEEMRATRKNITDLAIAIHKLNSSQIAGEQVLRKETKRSDFDR